MARVALLIAALSLVTTEAAAATYYVRSDGNDASAGNSNSASGAWRTISKANSVLRAGDIVNIISLNPADTSNTSSNVIRPSVSGTNAAGGAGRITYQGNPASPTGLPVWMVDLPSRSYITVRGVRLKNGYSMVGTTSSIASYNVIENCYIQGSGSMRGAQNSRISNCVMRLTQNAHYAGILWTSPNDLTAKPWCERDTLNDNYIDLGATGGDQRSFFVRGFTNNSVFARNRVRAVCDRNANADVGLTTYLIAIEESFANYYHDNRWDFEMLNQLDAGARWAALAVRSGTHHNLWERDSIFFGMNSSESWLGDISLGQSSLIDSAQVYANTWRGCFFKTRNSYTRFQLQMDDGVIEDCVFVNLRQPALQVEDASGNSISNSILRHNTFYSRDAQAFLIGARVSISNTTIESNIFYSGSAVQCTRGIGQWPSNAVNSNRNLYFATTGPSGAAMRVNTSCYSVGPGSTGCSGTGDECNSLWSNPLLADLNITSFNPALLPGSPAVGAQFVDGYAGAIAGFDATAPGQVTNLTTTQVGDVSAVLRWTAPGDDGQSGTVTSYDLRWSNAPITDANFASATALTPPTPVAGGLQQTYVMLNLTPGTTRYVALKARDDVGNISALSNVLTLTTATSDQIRPATVGDLGSP